MAEEKGGKALKRLRSGKISDDDSTADDNIDQENNYFDSVYRGNQNQAPQTQLRRQYSDLIENCQAITEKEGIETELKDLMTKNITEGNELFKRIGGGPGDMYMAFLHTKIYSGMILSKAEKIGSSMSGFTVDAFLQALIDRGMEGAEYSPKSLCDLLNQELKSGEKALSPVIIMLGSFDRNSICTPPEIKEKKPRAARKKMNDAGEVQSTQHEEISMTEAERARKDKDSPEAQSQEILRILRQDCGDRKSATNIVEFTMNKKSFPTYLENLFYISFLVRDGYVSIRRQRRTNSEKILDSDLLNIQSTRWRLQGVSDDRTMQQTGHPNIRHEQKKEELIYSWTEPVQF
ncbi:unnamed protein product [Allacma fusca]|uniref:Non-structural maintenance of chromosomes element 4 n=1 Tax=Allacma fusca TaxID=39272 RepID=A0A8J2PRN2_9HEXA|nr:unnamed protein product [Allacma fusca]